MDCYPRTNPILFLKIIATEEDASYFNFMRGGGKPAAKAKNSRGLSTSQLMKFFNNSAWSGFDDSPTVRF